MDEHFPVYVDGHELNAFEIDELVATYENEFELELLQPQFIH